MILLTMEDRAPESEIMVTGPICEILSRAVEGDVIAIPCLRAVSHDFGSDAMFEGVTLYGCVLFKSDEKSVLSRLYDSVEWIEPVQGTEVRSSDRAVTLIDEFGHAPNWCSDHPVLLRGKRKDLPEEFLWSFAPKDSN